MGNVFNIKDLETPFICGLKFGTTQNITHGSAAVSFVDSVAVSSELFDIYASLSAIKFSQSSSPSRAGNYFEQTLQFQFPNGDRLMAFRLHELLRARVFVIITTNGKALVLGRNDHKQNARPIIKERGDQRVTQVTVSTKSLLPVGNYATLTSNLLPSTFPVIL